MRLFVAAELPAGLRRHFASLQTELEGELPRVRWVRAEGIHLTLKFLGETKEALLGSIQEGLARCVREESPLRLLAGEAGLFPERGAPRLVWVPVGGDLDGARRLAVAIDREMVRLGFPAETRPFRPHLTLGRVKDRMTAGERSGLAKVAGRPGGAFPVDECILFESVLRPDGAVHTPLGRFPLLGPGRAEVGA